MAKAQYWIAKYIEDVFRDEPKNIGVIVDVDGERAARFRAETAPGKFDKKQIASPYPDVYTQWVEYWRDNLESDLSKCAGKNQYKLVYGGEVSGVGNDNADQVASNLFSMLVIDTGEHAEVGVEPESKRQSLVIAVRVAFKEKLILATKDDDPARLIRPQQIVRGKEREYPADFVQVNGNTTIIQVVDFTLSNKNHSRDHAVFSGYMFSDVKNVLKNSRKIAIVRENEQDRDHPDIRLGRDILHDESDEVFDWSDAGRRASLIKERMAAAMHQ